MNAPACSHLDMIQQVAPNTPAGCQECLETGGQWVNLRLCLTCGHVGCCDSSPNRHARQHVEQTGHAVVESFKGDALWRYCFIDDVMI